MKARHKFMSEMHLKRPQFTSVLVDLILKTEKESKSLTKLGRLKIYLQK